MRLSLSSSGIAPLCLSRIALLPALFLSSLLLRGAEPVKSVPGDASQIGVVMDKYCISCHDQEEKKGGLDLESLRPKEAAAHPDAWEKVIRKLRSRVMPPIGKPRPSELQYDTIVSRLSETLDRAAVAHPNPGRTETF